MKSKRISQYNGYQRRLTSMVFKFFDKKIVGSGTKSVPQNEQFIKELQKLIIREFKKKSAFSI